ncbi:MAG: putative ABC transporter permease, partial [Eubacterium sp.]
MKREYLILNGIQQNDMHYTLIDNFTIFFIYSFLGWLFEEIYSAIRYNKVMNRGILNGPICPVYGIAMVLVCNTMYDLAGKPVWQLIGAIVTVTVVEYIAGAFLYRVTGHKLWDYSNCFGNLNGYICLQASFGWGCAAVVVMWLFQPFIFITYKLIPDRISTIII